ncbi:nitroreductase family protein [soil metagenome]
MDFDEVIRRRHMVRSYLPDVVEADKVDRILDAARRAPSAGFSQPHRFVVITSQPVRNILAQACGESAAIARGLAPWLSVAPVHIIPCLDRNAYARRYAEPDKAGSGGPGQWPVPFDWVDGGAAIMLLLLAAVNEGLAAGFLAVDDAALRDALDVPPQWTPLGLVTVGYASQPEAKDPDAQEPDAKKPAADESGPVQTQRSTQGPVGSARRPRLSLDDIVLRY